jgi:hypothetical protein
MTVSSDRLVAAVGDACGGHGLEKAQHLLGLLVRLASLSRARSPPPLLMTSPAEKGSGNETAITRA